jgi:hypothetical protein
MKLVEGLSRSPPTLAPSGIVVLMDRDDRFPPAYKEGG